MNNFYSKIKNIEARINSAKTLGLSSSSSLSIVEKTFSVFLQIVPTRVVSGEVLDCGSSQYFYIEISTENNMPALLGLRLLSPTSFTEELYVSKYGADYNNFKYAYNILTFGSQRELDILNNGGTLPVVRYDFKIVSTSNITFTTRYENRH